MSDSVWIVLLGASCIAGLLWVLFGDWWDG